MCEENASWLFAKCLGDRMSVCVLHFVREPVPDFQCCAASFVTWSVRSPSALPRLHSALNTRRLPVCSPSPPQARVLSVSSFLVLLRNASSSVRSLGFFARRMQLVRSLGLRRRFDSSRCLRRLTPASRARASLVRVICLLKPGVTRPS